MLKGKQGRFRRNLFGETRRLLRPFGHCDRSDAELHQCGLPKKMALGAVQAVS